MGRYAIGIDLGGTKVEACLVDEKRSILSRKRRPSEPRLGREKVVGTILELVAETAGGALLEAAGMGTPRTYSAVDDIIYGAPHTPLYEEPGLVSLLRSRLPVPLAIENDANCLALAEFFAQCHGRYDTVMAVILGTGMGSGLILGGGVSNIPLWCDGVPPYMEKAIFGIPGRKVPILKAVLGDSAGVLGAAFLGLREMGLMQF